MMVKRTQFGRQAAPDATMPDVLAGVHGVIPRLPLGMVGLGAAGVLIGFGIVLWIAANWQAIDKFEKFALVGGAILTAAILGGVFERMRGGMALLGLLAIGGLYALYGQIYQVSSDAYVLFAMWAATGLAWVIAARSDAAWTLWVAIASSAIGLWAVFNGNVGVGLDAGRAYAAWAMAGGMALLLSPWARLEAYLGRTWWAFRLASVLALSLIASQTIAAIFAPTSGILWPAGAVILVGAAFLFANAQPFSLTLLALSALAVDGVLIAWITDLIGPSLRGAGGFLLLGLIYAGILGGSAVAVMRIAKERGAVGFAGRVSAFGMGSHWAVSLLSGTGALLAFVPFAIFLGLAFGPEIFRGASTYVIGGAAMAGAMFAMQGSSAMSFRQQAGFIGLMIGGGLVAFALFRDLPMEAACFVIFCVSVGLAMVAPSKWIVGLLGAVGGGAATWMMALLMVPAVDAGAPMMRYLKASGNLHWALLISGVGAAAGLVFFATQRTDTGDDAEYLERGEGYFTGWCGFALAAGLMGNPTFLLGADLKVLGTRLLHGVPLDLSVTPMKVAAVGVVVASFVMLASRETAWRRGSAMALAMILAVLAYLMPPIAVSVAVFAAAYLVGRRGLQLLALGAIVWLVGSFYYWLGLPLDTKAYLLAALGVVLGGVTLMSEAVSDVRLPKALEVKAPVPVWLALVLALVSAGSAFAVVGSGVAEKEAVLANGRQVLVRLAPVDPRSRIRGDYMTLNFEAPRLGTTWKRGEALPVWAVADVDPDGVARVRSFAGADAAEVSGDLLLKVRFRGRRMVLGTNAYFFEEGQGRKYQRARYGMFRVGADGEAILVGLADEARQRIE